MLNTFGITDLDEFGTFTYLIDKQGDMPLSGLLHMSYEFGDDIKNLIDNHPYLFGDILKSCIKYSLSCGDDISNIVLDMILLDYQYDENNTYNYDYASLLDMDEFLRDAVNKYNQMQNFERDLLDSLHEFSQNTKGILPNGSIITSLLMLTSYTPNAIIETETVTKQNYLDGQNLTLIGNKDGLNRLDFYGDLEISLTGGISGTFGVEHPASHLFVEASGDISTIIDNPASGKVSFGFNSSFDDLLSTKMDIATYVAKDTDGKTSIGLKFAFETIGGDAFVQVMEVTPTKELLDRTKVPETTLESNILLLYDVLQGQKTNLTESEKVTISNFLFNSVDNLVGDNSDLPLSEVNTMTQNLVNNILNATERPEFGENGLLDSSMYGILVDVMKDELNRELNI